MLKLLTSKDHHKTHHTAVLDDLRPTAAAHRWNILIKTQMLRSFAELSNEEGRYRRMQRNAHKAEIRGRWGIPQVDRSLRDGMGSVPAELAQVNPHRGWRSADDMRVTASEQVEQSGPEWRRRGTWRQVWRLIWTRESEHTHMHTHRGKAIKHSSSSASFLPTYVRGHLY